MTFQDPTSRGPEQPRPDYRLPDGTKVPSVTQALSALSKPALVTWAWRMGTQGIDIETHRDQAADAGTLAHHMIESTLRGEKASADGYSEAHVEAALRSWRLFRAWQAEHEVEPVLLEASLVSKLYRFGGTVDFAGRVDGRFEVIDFKTTSGIYLEHVVQAAAYRRLLEGHGHRPEAVRILSLPREGDPTSERVVEDTELHFSLFLAALDAYQWRRELEARERRRRRAPKQTAHQATEDESRPPAQGDHR